MATKISKRYRRRFKDRERGKGGIYERPLSIARKKAVLQIGTGEEPPWACLDWGGGRGVHLWYRGVGKVAKKKPPIKMRPTNTAVSGTGKAQRKRGEIASKFGRLEKSHLGVRLETYREAAVGPSY